jgi:hypothetical protein
VHGRLPRAARSIIAAALAVGIAAPAALGLGSDAVESVSVPQLQSAAQLPQTPDASVPVPSVPDLPVDVPEVPSAPAPQVPDVPQVQAPSAPSVPQVSAPQVRTPQAPGTNSPSGSGGSQSSPGAPGGASTPAGGGSTPAASGTEGAASNGSGRGARGRAVVAGSPQARAEARRRQRRSRDRRVGHTVRQLSGCLGLLSEDQRDFLSLRAGLDGSALTRGEAARELGITRSQGARLERGGLRSLRSTCGGGGGLATSYGQTIAAVATGGLPALQPQGLLAVSSEARPLLSTERLAGSQEVAGVDESFGAGPEGGQDPTPAPATTAPRPLAAATSDDRSAWLAIAAAIVLMAAVALLVMRATRSRIVPAAAGPASHEPEPEPSPAAAASPEPPESPLVPFGVEGPTAVRDRPPPLFTTGSPAPAPDRAPPAFDDEPARPEPDWSWPPVPEEEAGPEPAAEGSEPAPVAVPAAHRRGRDYGRPARQAATAASGVVAFVAREVRRRRAGRGR